MKEAASVGGLFGIIKLKSADQRIGGQSGNAQDVHGCFAETEYLVKDGCSGHDLEDRIPWDDGIAGDDRIAGNGNVIKRALNAGRQ
jgi:hypothetical protein